MSTYLISTIDVHDPAGYEEYKKLVPPRTGQVRRSVCRARGRDRI